METAVLRDAKQAPAGVDAAGATDEPPRRHRLSRGSQVAGKYTIHGVLGQGGFGVVYDAEHSGLARRVAIKVYHREAQAPAALIARFQREARLSALTRHANVLEVYDTGTLDDGSPFLVMERIRGETLSARLLKGRLQIAAAVELGCQLLDALAALAAHGIVHRDVKPDNLMLHDPGDGSLIVKLVDFGVCKRMNVEAAARITCQGALVGTPQYMSPEQLRGEDVDQRADLYAAGAVLYEALTGRTPHTGSTFSELVVSALYNKVRPIRTLRSNCPLGLERIVLKALSRDSEGRYASALQMREDLERFARQRGLPRGQAAWALPAHNRSEPVQPPGSSLLCDTAPPPPPAPRWNWKRYVMEHRALTAASLFGLAALEGAALHHRGGLDALRAPKAEQVSAIQHDLEPNPAQPSQLLAMASEAAPVVKELPRVDVSAAPPRTHAERVAELSDARAAKPSPTGPGAAMVPPAAAPAAQAAQDSAQLDVAAFVAARKTRPAMTQNAWRHLMRSALGAYVRGELVEAQALYRRAADLVPEEPASWRGLALVAAQRNHQAAAREAFARYSALAVRAPDRAALSARLATLDGD